MRFTKIFALSSVPLIALAVQPRKTCVQYNISVKPTSQNFAFTNQFQNNYDVVDFISNAVSRTGATFNPFSGKHNVTASYEISATFCTPRAEGRHKRTVILASHGLGFDRRFASHHLFSIHWC